MYRFCPEERDIFFFSEIKENNFVWLNLKLNNERNNCIIIFQLLLFLYYLSSSLGKKKYNFEKFYFDAIEIKNCIKNEFLN